MALFEVKPFDRAFYRENLSDFLPDRLFDVHVHMYSRTAGAAVDERTVSWPARVADCNPIEHLDETTKLLFPGKEYASLVFGSPTDCPSVDAANEYVSVHAAGAGHPALMLAHPGMSQNEMSEKLTRGGFCGIKVYLTFAPRHIRTDEIRIFDFLPRAQLEVCDQLGLAVMLHIARSRRLRDEQNISDLLEIKRNFRNVRLIVAHVGRAYCREDVGEALEILSGAENMLFDISANTNDWVFERLIKTIGSSRILYGSDLPVTRMRMRRVERDGRYVNLVPRGMYGEVSADPNMGELDPPESDHLSFFLYEEIAAFRRAALRAGMGKDEINRVFRANGEALFLQSERI